MRLIQWQWAIGGAFVSLGAFDFSADQPAVVVISNTGADGFVIIDAVQWLPLDAGR